MFTYHYKWVCILTSRPLRPTAAQTKWSSFSTLVKILEEQYVQDNMLVKITLHPICNNEFHPVGSYCNILQLRIYYKVRIHLTVLAQFQSTHKRQNVWIPTIRSPAKCHGDRSNRSYQPVRPVRSKDTARPKTPSLGRTPSELGDLRFSWNRQATQDVLERRRDEKRTERGWKSFE